MRPAGTTNVICSICRSQYDDAGWLALALTDRVDPAVAARFVLGWSPRVCIEVRLCRRCGKRIARRRVAA